MIFADYECPNCDFIMGTEIPEQGDYFDTLVICQGCGELHFRLVSFRGDVTAKMIIDGTPQVSDCKVKNVREV